MQRSTTAVRGQSVGQWVCMAWRRDAVVGHRSQISKLHCWSEWRSSTHAPLLVQVLSPHTGVRSFRTLSEVTFTEDATRRAGLGGRHVIVYPGMGGKCSAVGSQKRRRIQSIQYGGIACCGWGQETVRDGG